MSHECPHGNNVWFCMYLDNSTMSCDCTYVYTVIQTTVKMQTLVNDNVNLKPALSISPHLLLHPYRTDGGTVIERSLYTWRSHSPPVGIPGPPGACASAWSPPAGWRTHWGPPLSVPCCPYRCSWGSPQEDYSIDQIEINKYTALQIWIQIFFYTQYIC